MWSKGAGQCQHCSSSAVQAVTWNSPRSDTRSVPSLSVSKIRKMRDRALSKGGVMRCTHIQGAHRYATENVDRSTVNAESTEVRMGCGNQSTDV